MKRNKKERTTISIRLTEEQHQVLRRICRLKRTTQSAYLAYLAAEQARKELLDHAVRDYLEGRSSLSKLAAETGVDIPTLMDAVAQVSGDDKRGIEAFLSAAKTLSKTHNDPEFYELALKAVAK